MTADLSETERALLAFYRGEGSTPSGYTFQTVLGWPDAEWEYVHDFIQWMFPNDVPSAFNPDAPLLTPELVKLWAADPQLRDNLEAAFSRWLRFVGVERDNGGNFRFAASPNLGVWGSRNHNWLRITRVLKCLRLLHRGDDAKRLFAFLETVVAPRFWIDATTLHFWRDAVNG